MNRLLNRGFTIAEVLITLSILGVVAAIMIPGTVQKISDRQMVTAVKLAYSMLDNALQQMFIIEGKPSTWDWSAYTTAEQRSNFFSQKLAKYLSVSKFCGSSTGCFPSCSDSKCCVLPYGSRYCTLHEIDGYNNYIDSNAYGKMKLKNGMSLSSSITVWRFPTDGVTDNTNKIRIDINGTKRPNKIGYDVFIFEFNDNGLLHANADYYSYKYCNKSSPPSAASHLDGYTCSTWIVKHGNMDYKYRNIETEW